MNVTSAYEACPACNGHGHYFDGFKSEPDWCRECNGNGCVRARDSRGRFLGRVDPLVNEVVGNLLVAAVESELSKILPDLGRADIERLEQTY